MYTDSPSYVGDMPVTTRDTIIQAKNKEISSLEALLRHCNGQLERLEKDLQVGICCIHQRLWHVIPPSISSIYKGEKAI